MASTIEVFNIGTPVTLSEDGDFRGIITAICLRAGNITYEVSWWDGRTHKSEWLQYYEVNSKVPKMKIGFTYPTDERVKEMMNVVRQQFNSAQS